MWGVDEGSGRGERGVQVLLSLLGIAFSGNERITRRFDTPSSAGRLAHSSGEIRNLQVGFVSCNENLVNKILRRTLIYKQA